MVADRLPDDLRGGQRWHETDTGRTIVVLPGTTGGTHWWYYEDDPRRTPWHCCIEDFFLWWRFRFLGEG